MIVSKSKIWLYQKEVYLGFRHIHGSATKRYKMLSLKAGITPWVEKTRRQVSSVRRRPLPGIVIRILELAVFRIITILKLLEENSAYG